MAVNLRSKIPRSARLVVFDTNRAVSDKLAEQFDGVEVANTAREVAEKSVSQAPCSSYSGFLVLSGPNVQRHEWTQSVSLYSATSQPQNGLAD